MSDEDFLKLVDAGIDALRDDIKEKMHNVAIVIADEPSKAQRKEHNLGKDGVLFGLYEGIPQTERGVEDFLMMPDKITIFKNPILETYSDPKDIAQCVENTVWHEVAHHFGMDEDQVEEEEIKRGKLL
jgi:predicted Zn-dependent protease with MMP-like domain